MVYVKLVLDRSGSMGGMQTPVIKAVEKFVDALSREAIDQQVALMLFDHHLELRRDFTPLGSFKPVTEEDYRPDGDTRLYDAVAEAIAHMEPKVDPENRGAVAIVTDGQDTSSKNYDSRALRAIMDAKRETGRWMFVFPALDNAMPHDVMKELGIKEDDVIKATKSALPAAMKALTSKVRGYLSA